MPLYGDDLAYIDAATRDAFKGILYEVSAANGGHLILGGCEMTQNATTVTVAAGYVLINYEIWYFAGTSFALSLGANGTFVANPVSDPVGNRTFVNGSSASPYQTRVATFTGGTVSGGALDYDQMKRLGKAIHDLLLGQLTTSAAFSLLVGWSKLVGNEAVLYRHLKTVSLVGDLVPGTITSNSWTKITTLPTGYRPVKRFKVPCMAYVGTTPANGLVYLDFLTNGEVFAQNSGSTAWEVVSVNAVFVGA